MLTSSHSAAVIHSFRLAYSQPGPPSPAVLAAARGLLQLFVLLLALPWSAACVPPLVGDEEACPAALPAGAGGAEAAALRQPLLAAEQQGVHEASTGSTHFAAPDTGNQPSHDQEVPGARRRDLQRLPLGLPAAVLATLEIGGYNTTGTLCQTAGLAVSAAERAALQLQGRVPPSPALLALPAWLHRAPSCCCQSGCTDPAEMLRK